MDVPMLLENLEGAKNELTRAEEELLAELDRKFFSPLVITQCENVEVLDYWRKMDANGWKQNVDA